jgi:hypothetical protein
MGLKFLVEDIHDGLDFLIEEKNRQGEQKLYITGPFLMAEEKNQNGRIYPRDILEEKLEDYKVLVKERRAVGELDHTDLPVVELKNASHVMTDIWMEPDGTVRGKLEVLETPMGQILASLIKSNIKVGISSRALGSVNSDHRGDIVQDDLFFICFDIVSEPSTKSAWMMKESREYTKEELKQIMSRQQRITSAANSILNLHKKIRG